MAPGATDRYGTDFLAYGASYNAEAEMPRMVDGKRTAFVVSGTSSADAISAAPVADHERVPLLMTGPNTLGPGLRETLRRQIYGLGTSQIVIVGGPQAVSEQLETAGRSGQLPPPVAVADADVEEGGHRGGGGEAVLEEGSRYDPAPSARAAVEHELPDANQVARRHRQPAHLPSLMALSLLTAGGDGGGTRLVHQDVRSRALLGVSGSRRQHRPGGDGTRRASPDPGVQT